jgi:hypothetical protein
MPNVAPGTVIRSHVRVIQDDPPPGDSRQRLEVAMRAISLHASEAGAAQRPHRALFARQKELWDLSPEDWLEKLLEISSALEQSERDRSVSRADQTGSLADHLGLSRVTAGRG